VVTEWVTWNELKEEKAKDAFSAMRGPSLLGICGNVTRELVPGANLVFNLTATYCPGF
jgi:hypothetical protein